MIPVTRFFVCSSVPTDNIFQPSRGIEVLDTLEEAQANIKELLDEHPDAAYMIIEGTIIEHNNK